MKPQNNNLIIEPEQNSSIIETNIEDVKVGKIKFAGECYRVVGNEFVPLELNVGDRIIYSHYLCRAVEVDGQKIHVVKAEDVIAIL